MEEGSSTTNVADVLNSSDFYLVAILGLLLGTAELMGRYRDDPVRIFKCFYAWVYVSINAVLAVISLILIQKLGLSFVPDPANSTPADAGRIYDIIAAGFGGAAFFRSSVMKTKHGDTDIAIGPAIVIDTMLKVTDREVDRFRAQQRAQDIAKLMSGINLDQASRLVIPFCIALMQNVGAAEREKLQQSVLSLGKDTNIDSKTKPMILGLRLVDMVGFGVLESAVTALRDKMLLGTKSPAEDTRGWIRDVFETVKEATKLSPATKKENADSEADSAGSEADRQKTDTAAGQESAEGTPPRS
ncbi:MAG: hypothetical protein MI755_07600 [Sphingomonadales bacterium]|nr:hypothetical protein [Sphingomonadales bacterium]